VEVWTTCIDSLGTGENVYPAGLQQLSGVNVHRFPVDLRFRDERLFHEFTAKLMGYGQTTVEDEYTWIENNVHSPALYAHIMRHGKEFDLLLFIPYLYGITFYGASIWPGRTVIWPCLHDEPFAHFLQTRLMLASSRGVMFNSEAELALARDELGIPVSRPYIVGGAIDDFQADPARFRQRYGITQPFLLYAGRLEATKNVLQLVDFFVMYKEDRPGPLKLVLMGKGELPMAGHRDIEVIGFQEEQDKKDVYAAAMVLVQPSLKESFSIVIMESWLAGVPVLVHNNCDVTRTHVVRSDGGLYYAGFAEFAGTLNWFLNHPDERARMGKQGRAYVRRNYNRDAVLARFREAVSVWTREESIATD
jgi:glycosyltransferase involved in cell wall biosynthesis